MTAADKARLTSRDKYPCKDCTKRYPACQDHCDAYKQAKASNDARKAIERQKRSEVHEINGYCAAQATRIVGKKMPQR